MLVRLLREIIFEEKYFREVFWKGKILREVFHFRDENISRGGLSMEDQRYIRKNLICVIRLYQYFQSTVDCTT